ncbi:DUF2971 domain-containing protein [Clostridium butyricum]|nr:DUF2971 domain-containing protein [Clostridium butyricum]AXB86053.1 hypothetical protein DRB99_14055 [Clostridium butyricum]
MNEENLVYHYCSMQSFYNIFNSKELWLSDILEMNDGDEMILLLEGFKEIILQEYKKNPFKIQTEEKVNNKIIELSQEDVYNKIELFYDKYIYDFTHGGFLKQCAFIACFSRKNDLLSQWCMYANDAKGVAISFNVDYLQRYSHENKNFDFIKVKYINEQERESIQRKLADEFLLSFKEELPKGVYNSIMYPEKIKKSIGCDIYYSEDDKIEILFENLYDKCFTSILKESIKYKNDYFKQEDEWRLIYYQDDMFTDRPPETEIEKKQYNTIKYRLNGEKLIKYIKISLDEIVKGPQTKIYSIEGSPKVDVVFNYIFLGSKNINIPFEVMAFLTKQGYTFIVDCSKIPYK